MRYRRRVVRILRILGYGEIALKVRLVIATSFQAGFAPRRKSDNENTPPGLLQLLRSFAS
jgi:hypothetical protein